MSAKRKRSRRDRPHGFTLAQLAVELQKRGIPATRHSVRSAHRRGAVDLSPHVVYRSPAGQLVYYHPDAVDVLMRYYQRIEERRQTARQKRRERYQRHDKDFQFTTPQPPEVVERRLAEIRGKWPNDRERMTLWLQALFGLFETGSTIVQASLGPKPKSRRHIA